MEGLTLPLVNKSPILTNGTTTNKLKVTPNEAQQSFATFLKNSLNSVNELQNQSDLMTEKLVKGENIDLHQVMIAAQKASISLQTTIEIRNKVIEAYQEVMRMQI